MSDTLSTNYFPTPSQIAPVDIADSRARLVVILAAWWAELDTRPGSVFGDLDITPRAVLTAGTEIAWAKFKSDLQLSNIAQGIIYDADFVTAFLKNFGVSTQDPVASSGTIELIFSVNKSYVIDPNATFTFGNFVFQISPSAGDPVIIYPVGSNIGTWVLTPIAPGQFAIYLPVNGPAGATANDGDTPTSSLTQQEIISINAAGDFDPGELSESLPQLAVRAQKTFASASLTSRSGALSFINQTFPNLAGTSVVITGDLEMTRASQNPLGVSEGAVDVFLRSRPVFSAGQVVLTLTYDTNLQGWVGLLDLPVVPAFFDVVAGIFQVTRFQAGNGVNTVYSRSVHPRIDNIGVAFSKYEQLGLLIADTSPANFTPASNGNINETTGSGADLSVTGQYTSYFFNSSAGRSVSLRISAVTTINGIPALLATVVDNQNGETAAVYFIGNQSVNPTSGIIYTADLGYTRMFNGLSFILSGLGPTFVMSNYVGSNFIFSFNGSSASFNANYLFDAALVQADSLFQDPDNKPVQASIFTKSFIPCYVDQFVVNYRITMGGTFNAATAQQQIFNYLNSLAYPDIYEESVIGGIVTANGAASLLSVTKHGVFYPSLGGNYVNKAGAKSAIPRFPTTSLLPPANTFGFGPRNIGYFVNLQTILFTATVR